MAEEPARDLSLDMLSWFSDEELKGCPHCGQLSAVPAQSGPSVCLSCGAVWVDEV